MGTKTIATGSAGNCYRVKSGSSTMLIEAGIPVKKIKEGLDFNLNGVDGCIVSHQHKDHCLAIPELLNLGVPCFCLQEVADSLKLKNDYNLHIFNFNQQFKIETFTILPFSLEHDCPNSGFLIQSGKEKLLYITDSHYCKYKFSGLTRIMLEINYSDEILDENIKDGSVHESTRERLLYSHMSLENAKKFLLANDLSKCREIHLIHLSKRNSDPKFFKSEIEKATGVPTFVQNNG